MRLKIHVLALFVILANVLGNFLLSLGMKAYMAGAQPRALLYVKAFFSPVVLFGVALLIVWMLSRMTLMSWADLSFILPVTSIGYVLSAVMGKLFLGEDISNKRWIGTLLIMAGTLVVSFTRPRTHQAGPT